VRSSATREPARSPVVAAPALKATRSHERPWASIHAATGRIGNALLDTGLASRRMPRERDK